LKRRRKLLQTEVFGNFDRKQENTNPKIFSPSIPGL
jgi:hypothetical protein